jgi:hypothetical protein
MINIINNNAHNNLLNRPKGQNTNKISTILSPFLTSSLVLKRLMSRIKLYAVIINTNTISKILINLLIMVLINKVFHTFQVVYAQELEFVESNHSSAYNTEVVTMKDKIGAPVDLILSGNYDSLQGYEAYRVTKSEQAVLVTHVNEEQFKHIEEYYKAQKYKAIEEYKAARQAIMGVPFTKPKPPALYPYIHAKSEPSLPLLPELPIQMKIENFDYRRLLKDFEDLAISCQDDEPQKQFKRFLKFVQENIPNEFWCKNEVDIKEPNSVMRLFCNNLQSRSPLDTNAHIMCYNILTTTISTYNSSLALGVSANFDLMFNVYAETLRKFIE